MRAIRSNSLNPRARVPRRGVAIVYMAVAMLAAFAFASFAVDFGEVELTKTQLQNAADAAAMYAARGILDNTYVAKAQSVASANYADATAVSLQASDVVIGNWDTTKNPQFLSTRNPKNAVQVTALRTKARGNATSLTFGRLIGMNSCNITCISTAMATTTSNTVNVQGDDDPYLAGMPSGSTASYGGNGTSGSPYQHDTAPAQSPMSAGITLTSQTSLSFSTTGSVAYDPTYPLTGPDGDGNILTHSSGAENGISSVSMPGDSLLGVFLTASAPNTSGPPAALDFSTAASRDFTSLAPQLKQVFFIGDGKNSSGATQTFIVPAGATRLYLGTQDGFGWLDNIGSFNVTLARTKVSLVK